MAGTSTKHEKPSYGHDLTNMVHGVKLSEGIKNPETKKKYKEQYRQRALEMLRKHNGDQRFFAVMDPALKELLTEDDLAEFGLTKRIRE